MARTLVAAARANDLTITVPATANVGTVVRGNTISAAMGNINVVDTRTGIFTWITTVSATNLTTGGGTPAETISNSNIEYWSGAATAATGGGVRSPGQPFAVNNVRLSTPQQAFTATKSVGNTMVRWVPTLVITIPALAITGTYTAVISHSAA